MTDRMEFYVPGQPFDGGDYHYRESGLSNVYLRNGFTYEDDPEYGRLVRFHRQDELHKAIGLHIVARPGTVAPEEFRFLRKELSETQSLLGKRFGVSEQTIANYEKGETPIPKATAMALQMVFLLSIMPEDARAGMIQDIMGIRAAKRKRKTASALKREKLFYVWEEKRQPEPAYC
jgi:putative transcriptional regulator